MRDDNKPDRWVPPWVDEPGMSLKPRYWWLNVSLSKAHNPIKYGVKFMPGFMWDYSWGRYRRPKLKKHRKRMIRRHLSRELSKLAA